MRELVSLSNSYIDEEGDMPNFRLLANIAQYLSYLLRVFGVIPHEIAIGFPTDDDQQGDMVRMIIQIFLVLLNLS